MPTPLFTKTPEQSRNVRKLAGLGVPQEDIAYVLKIGRKTLTKYFRNELDEGGAVATANVAETLYKMATSGENTAATIFWMKARAKWSERVEHDHTYRHTPASQASDDALAAIALGGGPIIDSAEDNPDEPDGMVH